MNHATHLLQTSFVICAQKSPVQQQHQSEMEEFPKPETQATVFRTFAFLHALLLEAPALSAKHPENFILGGLHQYPCAAKCRKSSLLEKIYENSVVS